MPQIHLLSQDTVNKIAAGEVIERPMAVAMELIENAVDAKATAVTVEIQDGGKTLIRVTDNGSGIAQEDINLAFVPHATSKIADADDLPFVSSLGFRGEALASIAAVSQLEMVTKTREALMGVRYCMEGGKEKTQESIGCPNGTTFLVRNLFYNTPARLKFLKTSPTEAGYVSSVMERMALSRPDISFRFINQKQTKLSTSGNGKLKDVIYHIYGRDVTSNLVEVEKQEVLCAIKGFIGNPVISRGNRGMMNYFINGRYIKSPVLHHAIEEAYRPYTMQHRYPFTVLYITVDPEYVDVNVHPQKLEARFSREQDIYQDIYRTISETLRHREFIPNVTFQKKKKEKQKNAVPDLKPFVQKQKEALDQEGKPEEAFSQKEKPKDIVSREAESSWQKDKRFPMSENMVQRDSSEAARELNAQNVVLGRGFEGGDQQYPSAEGQFGEKEQLKESVGYPIPKGHVATKKDLEESMPYSDLQKRFLERTGQDVKEVLSGDCFAEHAAGTGSEPDVRKDIRQETLFEAGILSEKAQKEIKIIGQVFSTYWILQYKDKIYLVDQHAAHEKVLYERVMKELAKKEPMTQLLQPPIILSLSMAQQQAVEENQETLQRLGYQVENFGGREYAVNGVPAHLPSVGTQELLLEVIDSLAEERLKAKAPEILLDKVASMSCKAAVKGNSKLPPEQMQELLRELMGLENPYNCPHGRPTMISITKTELEKKFKRIV